MEMYIGEGFEGNGVNASHINIMIGPRDGVVGQAFSSSLASPEPRPLPVYGGGKTQRADQANDPVCQQG